MPHKVWAVGEEALAADWNTYLQQQVVPQFTSTAQRDAQYVAPPKGALCVTTDTLTTWQYDGAAWGAVLGGVGVERVVAASVVTANRGGAVANVETVCGPTISFTVVAGRTYTLRFFCRVTSSVATTCTIRFRQNGLAGALYQVNEMYPGGTITTGLTIVAPLVGLPAGAFTLCVTTQSSVGNVTLTANAQSPSEFSVLERI